MSPPGWRCAPPAVLVALAVALTGWGLLVAAMADSLWGLGGGQSSAVTAVTVTRGLWADCATDPAGVTSCVPLVSLVSLPGYLHGSRALAVLSAALGALALALGILSSQRSSVRAAAGAMLLLAGLSAIGAAIWFGICSTQEFLDPNTIGIRFEPGPSVPQAGGGGALQAAGGGALLWLARGGPRPALTPPTAAAAPPPALGDKYGRNEYV